VTAQDNECASAPESGYARPSESWLASGSGHDAVSPAVMSRPAGPAITREQTSPLPNLAQQRNRETQTSAERKLETLLQTHFDPPAGGSSEGPLVQTGPGWIQPRAKVLHERKDLLQGQSEQRQGQNQ